MPIVRYALTLQQPYADAVLRRENREDHTRRHRRTKKHLGERVYIYAGRSADDPREWARYGLSPGGSPNRLLLGTALLTECIPDDAGFKWMLQDPVRFDEPKSPRNRSAATREFWIPEL